MKKLFILLLLLAPVFSKGQTAVKMSQPLYLYQETGFCSLLQKFHFYGQATGYIAGVDPFTYYINYGDGITYVSTPYVTQDSTGLINFSQDFHHTFTSPGKYDLKIIVKAHDGKKDSVQYPVFISTNCDVIQGEIYIDKNANCVADTNEISNSFAVLECYIDSTLIDVQHVFPSGLNQYGYAFNVPRGYNCRTKISKTYRSFYGIVDQKSISCPAAKEYYYPANSLPAFNQDFALKQSVTISSIDVDSTSNATIYTCSQPAKFKFKLSAGTVSYNAGDLASIQVRFGDGRDTTITSTVAVLQSDIGNIDLWFNHTYTFAGNFSVNATVTMLKDGLADTLTLINKIIISDTCGNISGYVYKDLNKNCIYDAGEPAIKNIPVKISLNGNTIKWVYSDNNGKYSFDEALGRSYKIDIVGNSFNYGYSSTCLPNGITVSNAPSTNNNFGLSCRDTFDLRTFIFCSHLPQGRHGHADVYATANGCTPINSVVKFIMPQTVVKIASITPTPDKISGDTMFWNATMSINHAFHANIDLDVDSTATIGDVVCMAASVKIINGELNYTNNAVYTCYPIGNSHDPNLKQVFPLGGGPAGNTYPNQNMVYNIHFQNTGNDTAYNVFILDTLSPNLNWNTLKIEESSHNVSTSILKGGVLKFTFNNILLADSATNEPGSNGYVAYSIDQKPNLTDGTQIKNTANIYFDYNPAVVTNTTLNTIKKTLVGINEIVQKSLHIYPNPANGQLNIELLKAGDNDEIALMDMIGNVVYSQKAFGNNLSINTANLANGTYILLLKNATDILQREKIVIMH